MLTAAKKDTSGTLSSTPDLSAQPGLFIQFDLDNGELIFTNNTSFQGIGLDRSSFTYDELKPFLSGDSSRTIENIYSQRSRPAQFSMTLKGNDLLCSVSYHGNKALITGIPSTQHQIITELKQEMEQFAYVASHDLQEPLRKISTYVERMIAKMDPADQEALNSYTSRIDTSVNKMRSLIDDLLQFARTSRTLQITEVDLTAVLQNAINDLELKIEETKAQVLVQPLPAIQADATQLQQVFSNLISNALKFIAPGATPAIYIDQQPVSKEEEETYAISAEDHVKINVRDEGIGFRPEFSNKIFQMFQRLNAKHEYPGSGMGLAICKKIINDHHGIIIAKSNGEKGAAFTMILPKKQDPND